MLSASHENLLRAEVLAARIEAACSAEPGLGQLWRAEGAILEAVATVGLEGVRIDARDLLPRVAFNARGLTERGEAETLDAERALRALLVLKAPGNPFLDPEPCLSRLERLCGPSGTPVWGRHDDVEDESAHEGRGHGQPVLSRTSFRAALELVHPSDPPILGALRVVSGWRATSTRIEPLMERALFVAVEGALRGMAADPRAWDRRRRPPVVAPESDDDLLLRGLSESAYASWVTLPGLALTRPSFRQWDPLSPKGVAEFLEGLVPSLSLELGRLLPLRGWLEKARSVGQGRTGRSRLTDAALAFTSRPLMTASDLADQLGITPRGAINLATSLVDLGILGEVTHRRFARIWATPDIARHLEPRAVAQRSWRVQNSAAIQFPSTGASIPPSSEEPDPSRVAQEWSDRKAKSERRLERIYGSLDEALASADALLARTTRR